MIESLNSLFQTDHFKVLLGSGGLMSLIVIIGRWFLNRPKVQVKYVEETFDVKDNPNIEVTLTVELENHGRENTSFEIEASVCCLTADRKPLEFVLKTQNQSRTLLPVTPQQVNFKGQVSAKYIYSHFRTIKFKFSRGSKVRVRVLNASGQQASLLKFFLLKALFKFFRALPHV